MYDNDALTISYEQVGPGTHEFLPAGTTRYILALGVQQSGVASDTLIKCGNNIVLRNYARDTAFQTMSYKCSDAITLDKTGQDSAFINLTYVNRDLSLTPNLSVSASVSANINQDQIHLFYSFDVLILMLVGVIIGFLSFR